MCAGDRVDGGEDAWQGDSGGPLYDAENKKLVGITSWGKGCALQSHPGVYARISDQWDWIKTTICENSDKDVPDFCGPTPPSPTPPSPTPPSSDDCEELGRRACRRDPECTWVNRNVGCIATESPPVSSPVSSPTGSCA